MKSKLGVIIVAAGRGTRMKSAISKQYLLLQNRPIILHTLEAMQKLAVVDDIVLVVGAEDVVMARNWVEQYRLDKVKHVVAGGAERQSSVFKGLQMLDQNIEWVLVHDGVRPFVREEDVAHLVEKVKQVDAAVLAVPVTDTIKFVDDEGKIESTPDRSKLWSIQTPQAFRRSVLLEAHEAANAADFLGTDDAMLVERMGRPVYIVQGHYDNIKITTPEDFSRAEMILLRRE